MKLPPHVFTAVGILFAAFLTAAPADAKSIAGTRPNILVFLADDLGYGDLACYGHKTIRTPHLARLAREGMRLTDFYSASPVCSPSRAGLLTGRNPNRLGIRDWIPPNSGIYLSTRELTAAEVLKKAGYRTGHFGKWHLSSKVDGSEPTPGDHGFDHWFYTQNNAAPSHENPKNFVRNGTPVGPLNGNATALTVDELLGFLESGRTQEPFFASVWFHAPHEPVATPEEYTSLYDSEPDATKRIYYGSVSLIDAQVGRALKHLEDLKLRDNTLVIFTSDNGPETLLRYPAAKRSHGSPGHLRGMKLHLTEAGCRVPGIFSWPEQIRAGQVASTPVSTLDFLPTFAELAGVKLPGKLQLDGTSLAGWLVGKKLQRKQPLYWQYDIAISEPWTLAIRDGDWKLLGSADQRRYALYDLAQDPGETKDLARAEPSRLKKMAAQMRKIHGSVNAVEARK